MKTLYKSIKLLSISLSFLTLLFIASCGGDSDSPAQPDDANAYLNDNIILPPGSIRVSADQVTETNDITINSSGSSGTMQVVGGQTMNVSIPFTSNGPAVNAAALRFGDTGDFIIIPINGSSTSGTLDFSFGIPADICNNLNDICHDIRCYEYAVVDDGSGSNFQVSRANINQLATACGGCDEPQCVALLGPGCGAQGADGSPRFNLTWNTTGVDLDLYVTDPSGETISYQNTTSASGGELDVDCISSCTNENITWVNGGPSGSYSYYVNNLSSNSESFTIRVFDGGRIVDTKSGTVSGNSDSPTYTYSR